MLLFLPLLLPGALPRPLLIVFPAPVPPGAFSSPSFAPFLSFHFFSPLLLLLYSCLPSSLFIPSIFVIDFFLTISFFFIHFLFKVSPSLSMSSNEAEIGETLKTSLKDA